MALSPNNMKARIALNYKGLDFERIAVDPADRSNLIEATGRALTPALIDDGRIVYDSAAILRHLDYNYPHTPQLFPVDREAMMEVERLESFARSTLPEAPGMVFYMFTDNSPDADTSARASAMLNDLTADFEHRLESSPWLTGDVMSAADVSAAPFVFYGMIPDEIAAQSPPAAFFRDNLELGEDRERTRDWVMRYAG